MTAMQRQETAASDPEHIISHDEQTTIPKPKRTPLPKISLFIIFLIQLSEAVTATVIYPFINKFVRDTGVTGGDERKTGYFAGVIVSQTMIHRPGLIRFKGILVLPCRVRHRFPLGKGLRPIWEKAYIIAGATWADLHDVGLRVIKRFLDVGRL
jgi:hypothetical protein